MPHGRDTTTTVAAALRTGGLTAATLFDAASTDERFHASVADTLARRSSRAAAT